jgi:hypothetical protein
MAMTSARPDQLSPRPTPNLFRLDDFHVVFCPVLRGAILLLLLVLFTCNRHRDARANALAFPVRSLIAIASDHQTVAFDVSCPPYRALPSDGIPADLYRRPPASSSPLLFSTLFPTCRGCDCCLHLGLVHGHSRDHVNYRSFKSPCYP